MSQHKPELVSALLDGELHGLRRWRFERHLRGCIVCQADYRHIQHVRRMLAANPPKPVQMDDSPEFFWSKVKREIEARGAATVAVATPSPTIVDWLRGHLPALTTATVAVMVIAVGIGLLRPRPVTQGHQPSAPVVVRAETAIPDTVATAIAGQEAGVTVIWVSGLPWTPDMTEMQTLFAQLDT